MLPERSEDALSFHVDDLCKSFVKEYAAEREHYVQYNIAKSTKGVPSFQADHLGFVQQEAAVRAGYT